MAWESKPARKQYPYPNPPKNPGGGELPSAMLKGMMDAFKVHNVAKQRERQDRQLAMQEEQHKAKVNEIENNEKAKGLFGNIYNKKPVTKRLTGEEPFASHVPGQTREPTEEDIKQRVANIGQYDPGLAQVATNIDTQLNKPSWKEKKDYTQEQAKKLALYKTQMSEISKKETQKERKKSLMGFGYDEQTAGAMSVNDEVFSAVVENQFENPEYQYKVVDRGDQKDIVQIDPIKGQTKTLGSYKINQTPNQKQDADEEKYERMKDKVDINMDVIKKSLGDEADKQLEILFSATNGGISKGALEKSTQTLRGKINNINNPEEKQRLLQYLNEAEQAVYELNNWEKNINITDYLHD